MNDATNPFSNLNSTGTTSGRRRVGGGRGRLSGLAEAVAVLAGVRLFVGLVYKIFPFYTWLIVSPSQTAVARAMRQVFL